MLVFGAVFLVTTILIILFKNENGTSTLCFLFKKSSTYKVSKVSENDAGESIEDFEHEKLNLISTYKTIFRIYKIKIAFTVNSVQFLKYIEGGVTKEIQTLMDIPLTTLSIIWALLISKYTNGNKSLILNIIMIGFK